MATTTAVTKTTGPSSTSFQVWLATFISGLGTAVTAFVQNTNGIHTTVMGGGGLLVALGSTIFKLIHDQGLNKATLSAAGSDIAAALPDLRVDISKAVSFVETDLPGVKSVIDGLANRVTTLEAKVPDLTNIESTIRTVLVDVLKGNTPSA